MTILFSLGVAVSWGLWLLYNHLLASSTEWVQWCGIAVRIGFWVNNLIIVVVSLLSMLDWMRATCGRRETHEEHPVTRHHHPRPHIVLH